MSVPTPGSDSLRAAIERAPKGHRLYWIRELDVALFEDTANGSLLFFSAPTSAVFRLVDVDKSLGVARAILASAINAAVRTEVKEEATVQIEPAMAILPPEVTIASLGADSAKRLLDWRGTSVMNVVRARANAEFLTRTARVIEMLRSFRHGNLADHARHFRADRLAAEEAQRRANVPIDVATRLADGWSSTVSREAAEAIVAELLDTEHTRLADNDGVARRVHSVACVKEELVEGDSLLIIVPRKEWEAFCALYTHE